LEAKAKEKGIPIYEAFQGTIIFDVLKILSPTKDFYLDLLVESNKTPLEEHTQVKTTISAQIKKAILMALETWTNELLRENVSTSAENESSVILYGDMMDDTFLLTGDTGIRAFNIAINYSEKQGIDLTKINVQQIPHHGGRHNVSPSVLNKIVGPKVAQDSKLTKTAIVSVAKGSDHPMKMVTNAYIRRGAKVFEARTTTLRHQHGTPDREGWTSASNLEFSTNVEDWDD